MRPLRVLGTGLVLALLVGCVALTLVRWLGPAPRPAVLFASFGFAALPGYALASLLLLLLLRGARRRAPLVVALVLALGGTALHATWWVPAFTGPEAGAAGREPDLTVVTANLRFGRGDPAAVAAVLREERPDLVVLTEVTREAMSGLRGQGVAGPESPWPFQGGRPLPVAAGTVVLSAFPLAAERAIPLGNSGYRMTVRAPEPFTLSAVHTAYPLRSAAAWRRDLARVRQEVEQVGGPHLVVGDLNASTDHAAYREILRAGVRDAAEQAGAGWQPTWPTPGERSFLGVSVPLALLPLDQVLTSPDFGVVRTQTRRIADTDHLAVVAELTRR